MKEMYHEQFNFKLTAYIWMSWKLKHTMGTPSVPDLRKRDNGWFQIKYFMEIYIQLYYNDYAIEPLGYGRYTFKDTHINVEFPDSQGSN